MKIRLISIGILLFITVITFLNFTGRVFAQSEEPGLQPQEFFRAEVIKINKEGIKEVYGFKNLYQDLELRFLDGPGKGTVVNVVNGGESQITPLQKVVVGEKVVLSKITTQENNVTYLIEDKYRLDFLPYLLLGIAILIIITAGKKGAGSIIGLLFSLFVISKFLIPGIINGADPLYITITGSVAILFVTTYVAHGISRQTTIALISTLIALVVTAILSIIIVNITGLIGLGNDEVYSLQLNQTTSHINLQGLLLSGIIIGTLGALNDITTTQAAAVFEFAKTDRKLKFKDLYMKGSIIGKEHIASMINTLVLAYAGTSLVIFIIFVLNPSRQPYWVILNSEIIFDEIVRTVVGSTGLILAVPLVTLIASWYIARKA